MTDAGWQNYHGTAAVGASAGRRGGITTSANYTVSTCEGLISQGQAPLNVATGYMKPVSLINPPSEAEAQTIFDEDKGRCGTWRKHIFNITASVETPQFTSTAVRALASGLAALGHLPCDLGHAR